MRHGFSGVRGSWLALAMVLSLCLGNASAQDSAQIGYQIGYQGKLGETRIGMTLVVTGGAVAGGHYFYGKYLTDIPLTGTVQPGAVSLQGQDGGAFALNFSGNGSEGGKPLDFNNSVGLEGTWSKDGRSLPVKLSAQTQGPVPASGRRYEIVTERSDAAFESKVQGFYRAALAGEKATAAKYVSFPLRINHNGKSRTIRNAAELAAQWESIFTPAYIAALKNDMPHDMTVVKGEAMIGAGDAFFDAKGASALNLP